MKAEFQHGAAKVATLEQAVGPNVDAAKVLVRLAHGIEALEDGSYQKVEDELNQIGRMLGGWIKDVREGKSPR